MVRIKYHTVIGSRGNHLYTDWYTIGPNAIIRGEIDRKTLQFWVVAHNTQDQLVRGEADTLRAAKSKLKYLLKVQGVKFEDEIRSKSK